MATEDLTFRFNVTGNAVPQFQKVQQQISRVDRQVKAANRTVATHARQYDRTAAATNRFAGGALQQAGFQLGDFAVQVGGGTSAMQAFGQQGSQLLGVFGPLGAILGAGVAVVSAVAVAFGRASKSANALASSMLDVNSVNLDSIRGATSDLESIQKRYNEALRSSADASSGATRLILANSETEFNARKQVLNVERELLRLRSQNVINQLEELRSKQEELRQSALQTAETLGPGATALGSEYAGAAFDVEALRAALGGQLDDLRDNRLAIVQLEAELARLGIAADEASFIAGQVFDEMGGDADNTGRSVSRISDAFASLSGSVSNVVGGLSKMLPEVSPVQAKLLQMNQTLSNMTGINIAGIFQRAREFSSRLLSDTQLTAMTLNNMMEVAGGGGRGNAMAEWQRRMDDAAGNITNLANLPRIDIPFENGASAVRNMAEAVNTDLKQAIEQLTPLEEKMQSLGKSIAGSFEDAMMSAVDGTKTVAESFRSMAASIIKELYRVFVVKKITGFIEGAIGGLAGPGLSSGQAATVISELPGALAGRRAMGGPVTGQQPYMVGEKGPELFVPSRSGHIVPNNQMGSGNGVTVNQTINVSTGVAQTVRTEIKSLMPQIADSAKAAVADAKLRGGSYGRAF